MRKKTELKYIRSLYKVIEASIFCTTFSEISSFTGFTDKEIKMILTFHRKTAIVQRQLKNNRRHLEKSVLILDHSIVSNNDIVSKLMNYKASFLLCITESSYHKLIAMGAYHTLAGLNARKICGLVESNIIFVVNLDQKLTLLQFCQKYNDWIILLTSNLAMQVQSKNANFSIIMVCPIPRWFSNSFFSKDVVTFKEMWHIDDEFYLYNPSKKKIVVSSMSAIPEEKKFGMLKLNVGDDIYMLETSGDYQMFSHYKLLSLEPTNNSVCIYNKELRTVEDIKSLPQKYQLFFSK